MRRIIRSIPSFTLLLVLCLTWITGSVKRTDTSPQKSDRAKWFSTCVVKHSVELSDYLIVTGSFSASHRKHEVPRLWFPWPSNNLRWSI